MTSLSFDPLNQQPGVGTEPRHLPEQPPQLDDVAADEQS
jgi:hypothetical protein